jgi:hypothetical protein
MVQCTAYVALMASRGFVRRTRTRPYQTQPPVAMPQLNTTPSLMFVLLPRLLDLGQAQEPEAEGFTGPESRRH